MDRKEFLKLLGLLPMLSLPSGQFSKGQASDKPNVLFFVFDTLSAKHISLYGYQRDTMPNLARFTENASVFHQNYSGGSFTTPGTASILTGLYPSSHRAFQAYATVAQEHRTNNLFQLFRQAGYHTLSFSQNLLVNILVQDFNDGLSEYVPADSFALAAKEFSDDFFTKDYGIAVQAERTYLSPLGQYPNSIFLSLLSEFIGKRSVESIPSELRKGFPRGLPQNHDMFYVLEDLMDWLISYVPTLPNPYMAYLHVMPPHDPYHPRREFIGKFADQAVDIPTKPTHFFTEGRDEKFLNNKREQYDEYIAYVDAEFGRMINALEESGSLENTIVVFTSDHGELFERGIYRHITPVLYEGISRVPLLIRLPGQNGRTDIKSPTSNVDILPTLLKLTNLQIPDGLDGKTLPLSGDGDENRLIYTMDAKSNPKTGPIGLGTIAAIQEQKKLIHYFGYDDFSSQFEFYDLADDPEEVDNIYSPSDSIVQELTKLISKLRQ